MSVNNILDDSEDPLLHTKEYVYKDILISFENDFDRDSDSGLLTFIYQEYYKMDQNRLICFDMISKKIVVEIIANP